MRRVFLCPILKLLAKGGAKRVPPQAGEWLKATSSIPFVL